MLIFLVEHVEISTQTQINCAELFYQCRQFIDQYLLPDLCVLAQWIISAML